MNFFFSSRRRHTFFFQAEDGIRDRSPSRGLGDVYKRQVVDLGDVFLCSLIEVHGAKRYLDSRWLIPDIYDITTEIITNTNNPQPHHHVRKRGYPM